MIVTVVVIVIVIVVAPADLAALVNRNDTVELIDPDRPVTGS